MYKNWNTDVRAFKNKEEFTVWKLVQLINYGLGGEKLKRSDLYRYWDKIKNQIDPYRARMLEYLLWKRIYSLPNNIGFWNWPPKTNQLPLSSS